MGRDLTTEDEAGTLYAADLDKLLNAPSFLLNFARLAESGTFRAQLLTHIALSTFREDIRSHGKQLLRLDEKVDMLLQRQGVIVAEKPVGGPTSLGTSLGSTTASSTNMQESAGMKGTAELILCGKMDRILNAIGDLEDQIDAKLTMTTQEMRRVANSLERTGNHAGDSRSPERYPADIRQGSFPADIRTVPENKMTPFGQSRPLDSHNSRSRPGYDLSPPRPGYAESSHRSQASGDGSVPGGIGGILGGYDQRTSSRGAPSEGVYSTGGSSRAPSGADVPMMPTTNHMPQRANPGEFFITPRTNMARDQLRSSSVLAAPDVARPARLEPFLEFGDQYSTVPSSASDRDNSRRYPGVGYTPALPLFSGEREGRAVDDGFHSPQHRWS